MKVELQLVKLEEREIHSNLLEKYDRHPKNISSVHFWDKVISDYTNGKYELVNSYPRTEYDDGTLADVFFFNS